MKFISYDECCICGETIAVPVIGYTEENTPPFKRVRDGVKRRCFQCIIKRADELLTRLQHSER